MITMLARIFEHNNWANQKILQACSALSDEQLDAEPHSATKGNVRDTLTHLVGAQAGYLSLLTVPVNERQHKPLEFSDLEESALRSGEGLLAIAGSIHSVGHRGSPDQQQGKYDHSCFRTGRRTV